MENQPNFVRAALAVFTPIHSLPERNTPGESLRFYEQVTDALLYHLRESRFVSTTGFELEKPGPPARYFDGKRKGYRLVNVYRLELNGLYPGVIRHLYHQGGLEASNPAALQLFVDLSANHVQIRSLLPTPEAQRALKYYINCFYGSMLAPDHLARYRVKGIGEVTYQVDAIWKELLGAHPRELIAYSIDSAYVQGSREVAQALLARWQAIGIRGEVDYFVEGKFSSADDFTLIPPGSTAAWGRRTKTYEF